MKKSNDQRPKMTKALFQVTDLKVLNVSVANKKLEAEKRGVCGGGLMASKKREKERRKIHAPLGDDEYDNFF